jgi:hypothetical protein
MKSPREIYHLPPDWNRNKPTQGCSRPDSRKMERRTMREPLKRYGLQPYSFPASSSHQSSETMRKKVPEKDEDRRREIPDPRSGDDRAKMNRLSKV